MNSFKRTGKRWTVNECLQLQREFELLEMSIDDIAIKHQRTPNAIMHKLDQEGFADYNVLYFNNYNQTNDMLDMQPNLVNCEEPFSVSPHLELKLMQLEKQVQQLTQILKQQTLSHVYA
jgi:hypothetical protein